MKKKKTDIGFSGNENTNDNSETSELQHRLLYEKNPRPMLIYEIASLQILSVNERMRDKYGFSEEEFLAMTIKELRPKTEIPKLQKELELNKQGVNSFKTWVHKLKDGTLIDVEIITTNILFNGKEARIVVINDVTERKKYEREQAKLMHELAKNNEELKNKEEYLKGINAFAEVLLKKNTIDEIAWVIIDTVIRRLELEDCVIYLMDEDGKYLLQRAAYGNKEYVKYEILNPIKIKVGDGIVGKVASTGQPRLINDTTQVAEYIVDDKTRYSELAVPIIADKKVIGVIDSEYTDKNFFTNEHLETFSTIANLAATKIKNAIGQERQKVIEQALKESEARTRLIIDTALDAVIIADENTVVTDWNDQAEIIFGYKKEEAIGHSLSELIIPQDYREAHFNGVKKFHQTGEGPVIGKRIEITALRKGGEEFPVELAITPIYLNNKVQFSAFIRDITQQKKDQKSLIEARQKAEESSRAKEHFLANMSHEIRTPMNAIVGLSKLLKKVNLPQKEMKFLDAIITSSDNLLVIINDILDISKIEAGKLRIDPINFNFRELLDNLWDTISLRAEEKGLEIIKRIDPDLSEVLIGDPVRINQVLMNLLGNAIKFTNEGKVALSCQLIERTETTNTIRFSIADTGIGIAKNKLHHIFKSFSQEDETVNRKFGGTGLGLPISKLLVALMGGEIMVKTKKNVGAVFYFELTLKIGDQENIVSNKAEQENVESLKGIKVLLAEDNRFNQMYAIAILEQRGLDVTVAENGEEVIEAFNYSKFDIILMDIQMPIMDGIEATKELRKKYKTEIPIIALTANALIGDRNKYLEIGMNDYLSKPFEANILINKIKKLLGFSGQQENDTSTPKKTSLSNINSSDYYSLDKIIETSDGNQEFVDTMISIFINQTDEILNQFQVCLMQKDFDKVKKLAHKMKASVDMMNVFSMSTLVREVELFEDPEENEKAFSDKVKALHEVGIKVTELLKLELE